MSFSRETDGIFLQDCVCGGGHSRLHLGALHSPGGGGGDTGAQSHPPHSTLGHGKDLSHQRHAGIVFFSMG